MSVYAWADLHGRLDIFNEGLKYLNSEDKIYFLGDAADRGPYGWTIIKNIINDKRFIYLKGNHEDLMVKALQHWEPCDNEDEDRPFHWNSDMNLWYWNGGETTYNALDNDYSISKNEKLNIIKQLSNLPFLTIYNNIKGQKVILSHSGYDDYDYGDEEHFIWDRTHYMFYDSWDGKQNEVIVHGHTPIELMIEQQEENAAWNAYDMERIGNAFDKAKTPKPWPHKGAYWYGKNHKCNIDTGAVWNNHSVLLNLDTWEEIIIDLN